MARGAAFLAGPPPQLQRGMRNALQGVLEPGCLRLPLGPTDLTLKVNRHQQGGLHGVGEVVERVAGRAAIGCAAIR